MKPNSIPYAGVMTFDFDTRECKTVLHKPLEAGDVVLVQGDPHIVTHFIDDRQWTMKPMGFWQWAWWRLELKLGWARFWK